MPQLNPDGTVQVAPPTMSAFSPAASASAAPPPQPAAPPAAPAAGAIQALIAAIAQAFAPRSIVDAKARTGQAINKAEGGSTLGDELSR